MARMFAADAASAGPLERARAAYFSSFMIRGGFGERSGSFGETSANSVSLLCHFLSLSVTSREMGEWVSG